MKTPPKKKTAKAARPAASRRRSPAAKASPSRRSRKTSSTPARRTAPARGKTPPVPALLLEGDAPSPPPTRGPGERYALGATGAPPGSPPGGPTDLPEAYGTQRLLLTARDPRWLYAHWDMTAEQLRRHNGKSADRHLVLRIYQDRIEGEPHREIPVHPESRNWFAQVGAGGTRYLAELGYYRPKGPWVRVAVSGVAVTPPDNLSDDMSVWFASLAGDSMSDTLLGLIRTALRDQVPLQEALQQLRAAGYPGLPDPETAARGTWTPAQEAALAQAVTIDHLRRVWMGSLEITELLQRQLAEGWSSLAAAAPALGAPSSWSGAVSSLASPLGGLPPARKGFWFNVNAELIVYGATEKDATVTIGGRRIRLRADGTFSYRFSLPDGQYALPAVAVSADGTDARAAALQFSRATDYRGDVGQHPQDPALRPPRTEHVS